LPRAEHCKQPDLGRCGGPVRRPWRLGCCYSASLSDGCDAAIGNSASATSGHKWGTSTRFGFTAGRIKPLRVSRFGQIARLTACAKDGGRSVAARDIGSGLAAGLAANVRCDERGQHTVHQRMLNCAKIKEGKTSDERRWSRTREQAKWQPSRKSTTPLSHATLTESGTGWRQVTSPEPSTRKCTAATPKGCRWAQQTLPSLRSLSFQPRPLVEENLNQLRRLVLVV
jgi:hypothetical protein